jgi:hypothetical protein
MGDCKESVGEETYEPDPAYLRAVSQADEYLAHHDGMKKLGMDDDIMDLKSFYLQSTQGEVKDSDGQVKHRSDLDELLGMSTTSMDFDVASVEGEPSFKRTWKSNR